MTDSSNIGTDDKTFQRGDRRRMNLLGSRRWHTDGSYKKIPAKISFLQAHVVPEKGGETQFADMQAAYESFPPELFWGYADYKVFEVILLLYDACCE